jgi:hypothetical protein
MIRMGEFLSGAVGSGGLLTRRAYRFLQFIDQFGGDSQKKLLAFVIRRIAPSPRLGGV